MSPSGLRPAFKDWCEKENGGVYGFDGKKQHKLFGSPKPKTSIVDLHKINGIRPSFDVYIGRANKHTEFNLDSKWHNPFTICNTLAEKILENYENYIREKIEQNPIKYNLKELVGKKLGCWCLNTDNFNEPLRCHGQILLKLIKEMGLE
jgi:hypothetical protein